MKGGGWDWGSLQRQDLKESEVWPRLQRSHLLQGSVCGTVAPRRKRAGKIVLQSPNLPPASQASTHKQDSYTNLASDCSFDETQVRRREAGLQKRG